MSLPETETSASFPSTLPSTCRYSLPSDYYQFSSRRLGDSGPICSHGGAEVHDFHKVCFLFIFFILYQPWSMREDNMSACSTVTFHSYSLQSMQGNVLPNGLENSWK